MERVEKIVQSELSTWRIPWRKTRPSPARQVLIGSLVWSKRRRLVPIHELWCLEDQTLVVGRLPMVVSTSSLFLVLQKFTLQIDSSNQYAHEGLQSQSPTSMGSVVSPGVSSPLKLPSSLPLTQDEEEVSDDEYIQPIAARPQTPHVDVLCETVVTADSDSDENGTRLCRVSTAPSDSACERQREDQARHVASANKLARMGFAARGDVRHGVAARPVSPFAGSKPRFGGFKTLMQTLKGRP